MKIFIRLLFLSILLILQSGYLTAQRASLLQKANTLFNNKSYSKAIPSYLGYLKRDSLHAEAVFNLADCYRLTNDMYRAEKWYRKAVNFKESLPVHRLYLAEALLANSNYSEAKKWLEDYSKSATDDPRAKETLDFIKNLDAFSQTAEYIQVKKININSKEDDFSPVIYKNGIIFTSSRRKSVLVEQNDAWTGNNLYSIYFAALKDSLAFYKPVIFESYLQTKNNNGPLCISKDGKGMYFTSNSSEVKSSEGFVKLEIYEVKLSEDGKSWEKNITPFRWNSNSYNCTHPWLSPDGSKLFFASDMKRGYGGMDIYYCKKEGNTWSEPQNLGPAINTKRNEVFPYMDDKGILYFSSNGHSGFGSLDIYRSQATGDLFEKPENMGIPVNSSSDDFGIVLNGNTGYFSSNRENGGLDDDIYRLKISAPAKLKVKIKVVDSALVKGLSSAEVKIKTRNTKENITVKKEANGLYSAEVQSGNEYLIDVAATNYVSKTMTRKISQKTSEITVSLSKKVINARQQSSGSPICFKGFVYSYNDGLKSVLPGASISILEAVSGKKIAEIETGKNGICTLCNLEREKKYQAKLTLSNYFADVVEIPTYSIPNDTLEKDIHLIKINVGKPIKIDKVDFDSASWYLPSASEKGLDKIVKLMKDNPTIAIELSSHTDCRGIDQANFDLSNKRAQSLKEYFLSKNIDGKRLFSSGYGETVPLNKCECEGTAIPCSLVQNRENNRSEFKVIGFLRNGTIYAE